jgi:hypothetical protein
MKRVELGYCAWNHYDLGREAQYVGQKVRPHGSGEKGAEDELPSWRSMRSLTVKETALGLRSGSLATNGETQDHPVPRERACQGESKESSVQKQRRQCENLRD